MKELVMSRNELQILTNATYRGDKRYIHVSYPFYETELFTLDIEKPELTKIVRPDAFDWTRMSKKPIDRAVSADELPSYTDLRNCLLSSGFLATRTRRRSPGNSSSSGRRRETRTSGRGQCSSLLTPTSSMTGSCRDICR
ncbi:MAG: hypothetical protein MUO81_09390 [Thermoplasmata archaeon]|nr:hypothetical protein [Thermoplasmata archaeon]